jgi:DHA1 family tetracycline resistance protein-like MFS transporter
MDMLGYGMIVPLLPFYVQQQAGGAVLAGLLGSLYALMQLLSGPVLGALSDRYGRRPVLLACLLGTGLAFILLGLAQSMGMIFLAVLLDGVTGGNLTTAYAYIADVTLPEERARGLGMVGAAFGLGMIGGPALGGLLRAPGGWLYLRSARRLWRWRTWFLACWCCPNRFRWNSARRLFPGRD